MGGHIVRLETYRISLFENFINLKSLIHLDVSFCQLTYEDMLLMIELIVNSKTLMAIHLTGNEKDEYLINEYIIAFKA